MPRCFKPSLTEALLNEILVRYNNEPHRVLQFDTTQTIKTPDSITIKFGEQVYTISINEYSGEPVVAPPGDLAAILVKKFGPFPQSSIRDTIFQHISDINRTGCSDPVAGAAVGGAGGPAAFAPSDLLTTSPPSPGPNNDENPFTPAAAAATAATARANSPAFEFEENSPPNPGERKSRRRNRKTRKTRRSTRRKTRRYRTKQNRY
jgi:hypothetical protein